MPVTNFLEYAQTIRRTIDATLASGNAEIVSLEVDQRSLVRGFIKGTLRFKDASELHVREFIDLTLPEPRVMYAYHYQKSDGALVLRYDNAAHRPALAQLEHKHTAKSVNTTSAPTLAQVLYEIQSEME